MTLPDSWTNKPNAVPDYLEAIKQAEAPERFSIKFLEQLGYTSTNDRKLIGILKSLGFLDADGKPTPRYYEYLDLSRSEVVLAESIKEAFSDLFAVNKEAHKMESDQVKNKLKTLYAGSKNASVLGYIANTFVALVNCADFDSTAAVDRHARKSDVTEEHAAIAPNPNTAHPPKQNRARVSVEGLQYHINIVLPDTRDQAVYDAIFKSLRDHLG